MLRTSASWLTGAVIAGLLVGCGGPRTTGPAHAARVQFSTDDLCPVDRVAAKHVLRNDTPPAALQGDPERVEMWRRREYAREEADGRRTVLVEGCGDKVTYSCWNVSTNGKNDLGFACIASRGLPEPEPEQAPEAAPDQDQPDQAPHPTPQVVPQ